MRLSFEPSSIVVKRFPRLGFAGEAAKVARCSAMYLIEGKHERWVDR